MQITKRSIIPLWNCPVHMSSCSSGGRTVKPVIKNLFIWSSFWSLYMKVSLCKILDSNLNLMFSVCDFVWMVLAPDEVVVPCIGNHSNSGSMWMWRDECRACGYMNQSLQQWLTDQSTLSDDHPKSPRTYLKTTFVLSHIHTQNLFHLFKDSFLQSTWSVQLTN